MLYSWVAPGFVINKVFEKQFILGLLHWNWTVNSQGYSGVMPSVFSSEELGELRMPILMLIGDHDRLNSPRVIQTARQMIPHIETGIIPDAGHMLSMEQPGYVDQRVLDFLAQRLAYYLIVIPLYPVLNTYVGVFPDSFLARHI